MAKYRIFKKSPQISHIHKKSLFFKYNCIFLDQLLLLYKVHGSSMRGLLFFQFCQLWPVKSLLHTSLLKYLQHYLTLPLSLNANTEYEVRIINHDVLSAQSIIWSQKWNEVNYFTLVNCCQKDIFKVSKAKTLIQIIP